MISMSRLMSLDGFTALTILDSHKTYYGISIDIQIRSDVKLRR